MIYEPNSRTLVGVPSIDDRGRVTLKKWLDMDEDVVYHAHRFDDGSILLVAK